MRGRTTICLTALLVLVVLPVGARASREPTARERAAITAAARRTEGAPGLKVGVADIRISTVGPWAVATVTLTYPASSQEQEERFRRTGGRWSVSDAEMPLADQRDLGLAQTAFWQYFEIYLLVGWALALACVVDVLMQPAGAFAAIGRSKWRWLAIELVGGLLAGVFTWAAYAFGVRRGLVRAGGRRRWLAGVLLLAVPRFLRDLAVDTGGTPRRSSATDEPLDPQSWSAPASPEAPTPCSQCGGSRLIKCLQCDYTDHGAVCNVCGGAGMVPCFYCR